MPEQDVAGRSVQNDSDHHLTTPTEGRSVPNHFSQDIPCNNMQSAATSYTNISGENISGNPPTQTPPTGYSQNQCFSSATSSHHLNCEEITGQSLQSPKFRNQSRNRNTNCYGNESINENGINDKPFYEHNAWEHQNNYPRRTRQLELAQATANSQMPANDYGQLPSMSQETMDRNRYIPPYINDREQSHSNTMLQQLQLPSQLHQPQLPVVDNRQSNYDRNGPQNKKSNYKFVNGYKMRIDDEKSTVKSRLTENSVRATRPETAQSQRHQNEGSYKCDDRNTSYIPKEKTENKQGSQSFKLHNPWDFSNKKQDLGRKYRTAEKKLHVEMLLARNPRPTV